MPSWTSCSKNAPVSTWPPKLGCWQATKLTRAVIQSKSPTENDNSPGALSSQENRPCPKAHLRRNYSTTSSNQFFMCEEESSTKVLRSSSTPCNKPGSKRPHTHDVAGGGEQELQVPQAAVGPIPTLSAPWFPEGSTPQTLLSNSKRYNIPGMIEQTICPTPHQEI